MVGRFGIDCVWIDMEHRDFTYHDMATMTLAARACDMDAMVRIRKDSYADFFRPLEEGAAGLMVPHVRTLEEADWVVRNSRFAPLGMRGYDGVGADVDHYVNYRDDYTEFVNRETFVILQVEDRETVDICEQIAAKPGVDGLFVGPADLSQSYGKLLQFDAPEVQAAVDRVAAAAKANGKFWGMPCGDMDGARRLIDKGALFIAMGADLFYLYLAYKQLKDEWDALLKEIGSA
jgi:4-hydroxy-2-oxoheptanedioate aldolase